VEAAATSWAEAETGPPAEAVEVVAAEAAVVAAVDEGVAAAAEEAASAANCPSLTPRGPPSRHLVFRDPMVHEVHWVRA
jgi:hypothetical protein